MPIPRFFHGYGQGTRQLVESMYSFHLAALIGPGLEIQGKSAGLRTLAIVGSSAALILKISKHGLGDVVNAGTSVLDPSRVAAQIVSGIGFLGAGPIITRRGAVHWSTTARRSGNGFRSRGTRADELAGRHGQHAGHVGRHPG